MTRDEIAIIWDCVNNDSVKWPPQNMEELLIEIRCINGEIEAMDLRIDELDCAWHELNGDKELTESSLSDAQDEIEELQKRVWELEDDATKDKEAGEAEGDNQA